MLLPVLCQWQAELDPHGQDPEKRVAARVLVMGVLLLHHYWQESASMLVPCTPLMVRAALT